MSLHIQAGSGRQLIERWHALAVSRLDYLTELFESGRWRRFHTERDFLDNIQEAKSAVARWQAMAIQQTTADNAPVTWSWLDRPAGETSRGSVLPEPHRRLRRAAAEPAKPMLAYSAPKPVEAPARASVTPADLDWKRALDPDVLGERYPMLRAAAM